MDAKERAQARADAISERLDTRALNGIGKHAVEERFPGKKIYWLRKVADTLGAATEGLTPCKSGCSHCCHIPALITLPEAKVIAAETGAELTVPKVWKMHPNDSYTGTPCPFLQDNQCGIYEHRPVVCRTLYSLEDDSSPCDLNNGRPDGRVYYLDHFQYDMLALHALRSIHVADIRDFFPAPWRSSGGQNKSPPP